MSCRTMYRLVGFELLNDKGRLASPAFNPSPKCMQDSVGMGGLQGKLGLLERRGGRLHTVATELRADKNPAREAQSLRQKRPGQQVSAPCCSSACRRRPVTAGAGAVRPPAARRRPLPESRWARRCPSGCAAARPPAGASPGSGPVPAGWPGAAGWRRPLLFPTLALARQGRQRAPRATQPDSPAAPHETWPKSRRAGAAGQPGPGPGPRGRRRRPPLPPLCCPRGLQHPPAAAAAAAATLRAARPTWAAQPLAGHLQRAPCAATARRRCLQPPRSPPSCPAARRGAAGAACRRDPAAAPRHLLQARLHCSHHPQHRRVRLRDQQQVPRALLPPPPPPLQRRPHLLAAAVLKLRRASAATEARRPRLLLSAAAGQQAWQGLQQWPRPPAALGRGPHRPPRHQRAKTAAC